MDLSRAAPKLLEFDVAKSYSSRTVEQLNALAGELNRQKKLLSRYIGWYMEKRGDFGVPEPDINRLCRALAVPDVLAGKVLEEKNLGTYSNSPKSDELRKFAKDLYRFFPMLSSSGGSEKNSVKTLTSDANELVVYAGMYANIDVARFSDSVMNTSYFPRGNPFELMMNIMGMGGLIVRFKYVSRGGSEPEEKIVSYHPMYSIFGNDLAVHIQGDKRFSMSKLWGQGDEKLRMIDGRYKRTVVRWGRNDARRARDGMEEKGAAFLY